MILTTGGTGTIGRHLTDTLSERQQPVRVLARDAEKARRLLPTTVEIEAMKRQLIASGRSDESASMFAQISQNLAAGASAVVTEHVARILNKPPRSFRQFAQDHLEAFEGSAAHASTSPSSDLKTSKA